jgi:small conductance mechanosensitive channel
MGAVTDFLSSEELMTQVTTYGARGLGALVMLFVAWMVAGWLGRMVVRGSMRAKVEETLAKFLAKLVRWAVLILAILTCLTIFGIQVTTFAAVIGAAGLAVGLAFQGSLSNFSSGVMLLVFRPFKVGDVVKVAGELGKVNEIELFTTALDTPDNRRIILPNSSVFGATIENITFHDIRRVDVSVGVSYGADVDKTREVLSQAALAVPGRIEEPEIQILLLELGASSVDWVVRVWCNTADYWDVRDATVRSVKVALDEARISIPFPQMDVHLDKQE